MKKYYFLIVTMLLLSYGGNISSQILAIDSISNYIPTKYVVPDLPAFSALGTEPLELLTPSTAKNFSFTADQFYDGKNIIIPKSFALEFSPISLLKKADLTLADYQKSAAWYNTRISFGSFRDSTNITRVAIGFRTTLIDDGDPKRDKNLKEIFKTLDEKRDLRKMYIDKKLAEWTESHKGQTPNFDELSTKYFNQFNALYDSKNDSLYQLKNEYYQKNMKSIIGDYAGDKRWNAQKLDVALALVCNSPDSLAKNLKFNALLGWMTYALPIGDQAQFLIALNGGLNLYNDKFYYNVSVPARLYVGNNMLKGLVEGQYIYRPQFDESNIVAKLGCEYRFAENLWLNVTVGFENNLANNTSNLISGFKIKYGI